MGKRSDQASRLFALDLLSSVVATHDHVGNVRVAYTPFGHATAGNNARTAFAGQWCERHGVYLLGNGHRLYVPTLMRFSQADHCSPFGKGGLSTYAYCSAQPVSLRDPTGRWAWFIVSGLAAAAAASFGTGAVIAARNGGDKTFSVFLGGLAAAATGASIFFGYRGVRQMLSRNLTNASRSSGLALPLDDLQQPVPRRGPVRAVNVRQGMPATQPPPAYATVGLPDFDDAMAMRETGRYLYAPTADKTRRRWAFFNGRS